MVEEIPKVYDILHPTPVPLKDLSAIAISLEIWRYEITKFRADESHLFQILWLQNTTENTSLKTMLPGVPRVINDFIEKYLEIFKQSLRIWLRLHRSEVFSGYFPSEGHNHWTDFDDFVVDFHGGIHHVRTAERIMCSDRLGVATKFKTACMYAFEADIRRIWPSVRETISLKRKFQSSYYRNCFDECEYLYYWGHRVKHDLNEISISQTSMQRLDEEMLRTGATCYNTSALEYFWNRLPFESRFQAAVKIIELEGECFARFILPRLDDLQLEQFVNEHGGKLLIALFDKQLEDELTSTAVIPTTWMYIRNIMNENTFTNLAVNMMTNQDYDEDLRNDWLNFCREIWYSAPPKLKRTATRDILSNAEFFKNMVPANEVISIPKYVDFLLTILHDADFDERSTFWHKTWTHLIASAPNEDIQRIMQLCFANEHEIALYKKNGITGGGNLRELCISLLHDVEFDKLHDIAILCYAEEQTARNFEKDLLQSILLGQYSQLSNIVVLNPTFLNEFINNVYGGADADLSIEFKNQLMSSPAFLRFVSEFTSSRHYEWLSLKDVIDFINTFVPIEQAILQIKALIINSIKENLTANRENCGVLKMRFFNEFLSWCVGSDEEAEEFKRTYNL